MINELRGQLMKGGQPPSCTPKLFLKPRLTSSDEIWDMTPPKKKNPCHPPKKDGLGGSYGPPSWHHPPGAH